MGRQFHSYVSKYLGFIRFMIGIVMSFLYFFIRIGMSQMQQCEYLLSKREASNWRKGSRERGAPSAIALQDRDPRYEVL